MRLFVAVNFDDAVKDFLDASVCQLRDKALAGRFPQRNNLHLTLAFLGEVASARDAVAAVKTLRWEPFCVHLGGIGAFPAGSRGATFWQGVVPNEALTRLHGDLITALQAHGVKTDTKPFKPHITIGRDVVLKNAGDISVLRADNRTTEVPVRAVDIMRSELGYGPPKYSIVLSARYNNEE